MTNEELVNEFLKWVRKEANLKHLTDQEIFAIIWLNMSKKERKEIIQGWYEKIFNIVIKSLKGGGDSGKTTDA